MRSRSDVPLQMRGPGVPQGVTINPLVINADLAPDDRRRGEHTMPG